jgi:PAS domain-containing protein
MTTTKSQRRTPKARNARVDLSDAFEDNVLRLIKRAPERRAIRAGEVDAILDPITGRAILMPAAQAALIERKARFRSLVDLTSDGYWEQDPEHRFVVQTGASIGNERSGDGAILGKTLWELSFDNGGEIDWQTHRTQLEWRAIFRDLELRYLDHSGRARKVSISGEPTFDAAGEFTGYRGITRDITDREPASPAAADSERFARATLDALATQVCVLDAQGSIIAANAAWRTFAVAFGGIGPPIAEGDNYLAACASTEGAECVDAAAMAAGVRQVIAGERDAFSYERRCGVPPAACWIAATVTRLRGAGVARAVVAYQDITASKRAVQLQQLECAVARCLAVGDDTAAAVRDVIRAVCATQDWDCGRLFRLDSAAGLLVGAESWGLPDSAVSVRADAGLVGRACESREPLWSSGAAQSPDALAHEVGLGGAFVSPVTAGGQPVGALVFNGRRIVEPDERVLGAMRSIGEQLGRFMQRRSAESELRLREERFRRLTELSADWHWEQDAQFRYTRVAGHGIVATEEMLGKTLWELPGIVLSEEQRVAHSAEVAAQWSFCDFDCAVALPNGQLRYYRVSGEPLYDAAGVFSGFHGTGLDITERRRAAQE